MTEHNIYQNMSVTWLRRHKKDIDIALQVRSKVAMVKGDDRQMEVIFITGQARCGKSTLAKKLAKEKGYSYYVSSTGEHPFDDYMGQDAVILDDLRPSDFKFSELLKVLDNHMSAKISARYHNIDLNCKVIYITTTLRLDEFYKALRESTGEATEQLQGRINTMVELSKSYMRVFYLDNSNEHYNLIGEMPNPLLTDDEIKLMTEEERKQKAIELLGGLGTMLQNTAKVVAAAEIPPEFKQVIDEEYDQIEF